MVYNNKKQVSDVVGSRLSTNAVSLAQCTFQFQPHIQHSTTCIALHSD